MTPVDWPDHCGDLTTKHPTEKPLTIEVPGDLGRALFGDMPAGGGSIHGYDLRDCAFDFDGDEGGAGVVVVGGTRFDISAQVHRDLFEDIEESGTA
jgi:hypothetical protein